MASANASRVSARLFRAVCASAAFVSLASMTTQHAHAQAYPNQTIRSLCNFAPGTGADVVVRFISRELEKLSGVTVVVENRAGAQGTLATNTLAKAKPDGYTILITPASSTLAAAPFLFKQLPFDPIKDFQPVATLARTPFVFIARPDEKVRSMRDLAAVLKAKGGRGFFGASNNTGVIVSTLFNKMAGLNMEPVSFTNAQDALRTMLSGDVDLLAYDSTWAVGQAKSGKVTALAVTSAQRLSALPDTPTMIEQGFPGFDVSAWWAVVVPAGTPKPVVDKLAGWFRVIGEQPETKEFWGRAASDPMPGGPEDMAALLKKEMDSWKNYVALANIEPK